MRTSLIVATSVLAGLAGAAVGQTSLYSNASNNLDAPALATGSVSTGGAVAPMGGEWSELSAASLTEANALAGFSAHVFAPTTAYRFADDFTVPDGLSWRIDRLRVYAYQPLAELMPFSALTVEIWSGRPDLPGSQRLIGDTTTNRLIGSAPTNVYRIFNQTVAPAPTPADAGRRLWRADADTGQTTLEAGTYWITWQFTPVNPAEAVFAPAATIPGVRSAAGWNALVLKPGGWAAALDTGKPETAADVPQDFAFMLVGVSSCSVDYNRDGFLNQEDLGGYLTAFLDESVPTGPTGTSSAPCPGAPPPYDELGYAADFNRDCNFDQEDLGAFITEFFLQAESPNGCVAG